MSNWPDALAWATALRVFTLLLHAASATTASSMSIATRAVRQRGRRIMPGSPGCVRMVDGRMASVTRCSGLRQGHAALALVFAAAIGIAGVAHFVGFEKQHLRHALVGVDARRQRRGVGKFQRHVAFPFRLQRRDVDDDAAARVGALAQAYGQYLARNAEILHRARQRERVGRNHASIAFDIDETARIEFLGIDDGGVDVGEHLELVGAAHAVTVAGGAVGNQLVPAVATHLAGLERLDHALLGRHSADPLVALYAHVFARCARGNGEWGIECGMYNPFTIPYSPFPIPGSHGSQVLLIEIFGKPMLLLRALSDSRAAVVRA